MVSLLDTITRVHNLVQRIPGVEVRDIKITDPVPEWEILGLENFLGCQLPASLRRVYVEECGSAESTWIDRQHVLGLDVRYGGFSLAPPSEIRDLVQLYRDIAKDYQTDPNWETDEYARIAVYTWPRWIPVIQFDTGDCICLDPTEGEGDYPAISLNHEYDTAQNGVHLASNFDELVRLWSMVAFAEVYNWSDAVSGTGINPDATMFAHLRKYLSGA